ncbi:ArsR family transcriptional regulator [Kitasatospora sp. NPDC092039]|uniref:ArsR family transcriptional regulator n=1 Tax=Kitasatospora sp. NPDC092039 TaxID=3364086 RepID=UPI0037F4BB6F
MQRIHFTAADLARTRLKSTLGPLVESAFARDLLDRGVSAPYARWRKQVNERLPRRPAARPHGRPEHDVEALLRQALRYAEEPDAPPGAAEVPERPGAGVDACLLEAWQLAVAPFWQHLHAYLVAECEARGRAVMAGGVELLLSTAHPRMTWRAPVLEVPGGPDQDIRLGGRGLVLTPSVFLNHRPGVAIDAEGPDEQVVLVFAAPPHALKGAQLWQERDRSTRPLGALVGQTRAAALRALRASCTTSQLADRLGISAASASQHAAVLRQTGLITTRRVRNTVLHSVTPLGMALLDGGPVRPVPAIGNRDRADRADRPVRGVRPRSTSRLLAS